MQGSLNRIERLEGVSARVVCVCTRIALDSGVARDVFITGTEGEKRIRPLSLSLSLDTVLLLRCTTFRIYAIGGRGFGSDLCLGMAPATVKGTPRVCCTQF